LAFRPMVAKNASISGSFRLISKSISISMLFSYQQRQRHQQAAGNGFRNGVFLEEGTV
jgi:hypothetical protein